MPTRVHGSKNLRRIGVLLIDSLHFTLSHQVAMQPQTNTSMQLVRNLCGIYAHRNPQRLFLSLPHTTMFPIAIVVLVVLFAVLLWAHHPREDKPARPLPPTREFKCRGSFCRLTCCFSEEASHLGASRPTPNKAPPTFLTAPYCMSFQVHSNMCKPY